MNYRRTLLCLLFALMIPVAAAQPKIIERSSARAPQWFGGAEKDYIITTSRNAELEVAKRQAFDAVSREIIESVAQNVSSSMQMTTDQKTTQSGIAQYLEHFSAQSATQAATLPFLKGISSNKIADFYWQKVYDKKTGVSYYDYSLKYPFSKADLRSLTAEFEAMDKKMVDQMNALSVALPTVSSVAQIEGAILELDNLITYFFDPVRRGEATNLQSRYRKCYDNIAFETISSELGAARYRLTLGGRAIIAAQVPTIKSNCATQVEITPSLADSSFVVRYNYDGCIDTEENNIKVSYRFGAKVVSGSLYFDVASAYVAIAAIDKVVLRPAVKADSVASIAVEITLDSKYDAPFIVRSVDLSVPSISAPLVATGLSVEYKGKGIHKLQVVCDGDFAISKVTKASLDMARGRIVVENKKTGERKSVSVGLGYSLL